MLGRFPGLLAPLRKTSMTRVITYDLSFSPLLTAAHISSYVASAAAEGHRRHPLRRYHSWDGCAVQNDWSHPPSSKSLALMITSTM